MAKSIVPDPDHKTSEERQLTEREWEDGGWAQFEAWAGISWFGGHSEHTERYGTIRCDRQVPSKFPIHDKTEGAINERLEERIERLDDFD